jgi:hypothetical protein
MTTTVVSDPPSATVVLDGEIDIATAPAIRRFLMAAISGGNVHLAVDAQRLLPMFPTSSRPPSCGGSALVDPQRAAVLPQVRGARSTHDLRAGQNFGG